MELIPIKSTIEENTEFINHPDCQESIYITIEFFRQVGYHPPWISYYAQQNGELVGVGAFKGAPISGKVEIAYGTFDKFRRQGIGTMICEKLVALSILTDPTVVITARTLPEMNYSTRILQKNDFKLLGTIQDEDDGEVWEWKYAPSYTIT